ncbi:hypothetical protein Patl1_19688 [Pistacia atlantica]|uniref:Uncharacterized protein n=1 Tax=Pistacia atlantica TaxID=434234 RepID=A0ACC1C183_9ROSI|nr:hypothetical protein Patl1_19688 [Pistacia atlantica]
MEPLILIPSTSTQAASAETPSPKAFFGTATSAYQVEGMANQDGRGPSIWDVFIKKPGIVANNGTGDIAVDQYHRYKKEEMMLGRSFDANSATNFKRLKIPMWSWQNGAGKVNWKGVAYYNRLINYLLEKGITPYANLYHYDLPEALEKKYNGLLSEKVVKSRREGLEFSWILFGMNLLQDQRQTTMQRKEQEIFMLDDVKHGVPIGPRANSYWLYNVPWGMYKALMYIKEHYKNPTVILSENGMDDPGNVTLRQGLHDTTRINFYKGYLTQLKKAADDGANVVGYFAWSLLDNFEWRLGYTARFGIVYVDYTNLKRYPKMSALLV